METFPTGTAMVVGWLKLAALVLALTLYGRIRLFFPFTVIPPHHGGQSSRRRHSKPESFKFCCHVNALSSSSPEYRIITPAIENNSLPPPATFRFIPARPLPSEDSAQPPPPASTSRSTAARKPRAKKSKSVRGISSSEDPDSMGISCDVCQKIIGRKADLPRHKRLHLTPAEREQMMIHCPYPDCSYKNMQQSNVDTHLRTHDGVKDKQCPSCKFITADPGSLTRHRKSVHGYVPHTRRNGFACGSDSSSSNTKQDRKDRALPYARSASSSSSSSSSSSPDPELEFFWLQQQKEQNKNLPFQHYILDHFTPSPPQLAPALGAPKLEDYTQTDEELFHPAVLAFSSAFEAPNQVSGGSVGAEERYWADMTREIDAVCAPASYTPATHVDFDFGFDFSVRAPSPEPWSPSTPSSSVVESNWSLSPNPNEYTSPLPTEFHLPTSTSSAANYPSDELSSFLAPPAYLAPVDFVLPPSPEQLALLQAEFDRQDWLASFPSLQSSLPLPQLVF